MTEKRFNSPLYSNMVIDMEHKIPSILCINEKQKNEFLNGLNALHEENEQLKQQNDFLTTQLAELSTYMMALGYDIELEFEGGRVIKLNEELKGGVE